MVNRLNILHNTKRYRSRSVYGSQIGDVNYWWSYKLRLGILLLSLPEASILSLSAPHAIPLLLQGRQPQ